MSRFFVGQRVVLVRGFDFVTRADNFGIMGRISAFANLPKGARTFSGTSPIDCDVEVVWDGDSPGARAQNTLQLEPILPEGHAPSVYSFEELMDKCRSGVVA